MDAFHGLQTSKWSEKRKNGCHNCLGVFFFLGYIFLYGFFSYCWTYYVLVCRRFGEWWCSHLNDSSCRIWFEFSSWIDSASEGADGSSIFYHFLVDACKWYWNCRLGIGSVENWVRSGSLLPWRCLGIHPRMLIDLHLSGTCFVSPRGNYEFFFFFCRFRYTDFRCGIRSLCWKTLSGNQTTAGDSISYPTNQTELRTLPLIWR